MRPPLAAAAGLLLVLTAGGAFAQSDACGSFKWPVTRELKDFAGELPRLATGSPSPQPGAAVSVALAPQEGVAYTVKPRRAPKSAPAYGAELTGVLVQGGTYQVTLSDDAWVDVVQGGKVLRSTDFSGKTGCPGVRKSVRFDLAAGPLAIAISDAPVSSLDLELVPAE